MDARHVVLVTYGEPAAPQFGPQLAYSWRILLGLTRTVAPIPLPLVPVMAVARARNRCRTWREEGYKSPLEAITVEQARRLGSALKTRAGGSWRVHVGYEFRRPGLSDVLGTIPPQDPAWVLPMYATDSAFTHALSRATVANLRTPRGAPTAVLPALDVPVLAEISAAHVLRTVAGARDWTGTDVALVLAAHGTLLDPPRPIDTGLEAMECLRRSLQDRLTPHFGLVMHGWLNHTRGGRWTAPPVDQALRHVVAAGFRRVVYYPYGFLADNAETELEGLAALRDRPELEALRVPCLNDSPLLVDLLADVLADTAVLGWRPAGRRPRRRGRIRSEARP